MASSKKRSPSKTPPASRKRRRSGQAIVTVSGKDHYVGPHNTERILSTFHLSIRVKAAQFREMKVR